MIKNKKVYNFLKVCEIFYESEEIVLKIISLGSFFMVRIYSYVPLKLPDNFKLLSEKKTTRIVLYDKSADEIALSFRKNYRNEIRKTYRDDCVLAKIEEGFSKDGYALYKEFEMQARRPYLVEKEIGGVWALGYINGELVSGIYLIDTSPVLKVVSIFSVRKQANVQNATLIGCVGKRLMYDVCLWAKKRHYEYVDLAFFDENDEIKAGIAKYKLGFGGDVVNEYMYEKKTMTIDFLKFIRRKVGI
jgi:hypothetical protein